MELNTIIKIKKVTKIVQQSMNRLWFEIHKKCTIADIWQFLQNFYLFIPVKAKVVKFRLGGRGAFRRETHMVVFYFERLKLSLRESLPSFLQT